MNALKDLWFNGPQDDSGQDLVEYALTVAVIALGAVASLRSFAEVLNRVPSSLMQKFWTAFTT